VGRIKSFNNIDSFGERLKLIRLCFQITQSELADMMDLTQGTLTKIERNLFLPDRNMVEPLFDLFSLNPLYLRFGEPPIFTKKMVFCDFVIADRNRKLQNLFPGEAIGKIILYILGKEQVQERIIVSGKPIYSIFIFVSHVNDPHYLIIRTDIEAGSIIRETLKQHNLKTYNFDNSSLLEAFSLIYHKEYQSSRYKKFMEVLGKIDIPQNMNFLLNYSEKEIMAPYTITESDEEIIDYLLDFFIKHKVTEKNIRAAMKRLKEIRKLEKEGSA
jgi:transcriptional regulator with XRE-family HTH domain